MSNAILLISCPDQKGITATVTQFIFQHNGNIISADQHIDEQSNTFFMRVEWSLEGFELPGDSLRAAFDVIAQKFSMVFDLSFSTEKSRAAIFVSRHLHCLYDLLYRYKVGQIPGEVVVVVSNHSNGKRICEDFGVRFVETPITPENKSQQEQRQMKILKEENIDLVILARYHQILSRDFVHLFDERIINIHHSFLPAFAGKNPYAQAYQKGVKIIGASAHYVTTGLDEGPIIEQDTVRVSHRDALKDLVSKGEDLEKVVLSRALRRHLEKKILCYNNKTVVFD